MQIASPNSDKKRSPRPLFSFVLMNVAVLEKIEVEMACRLSVTLYRVEPEDLDALMAKDDSFYGHDLAEFGRIVRR